MPTVRDFSLSFDRPGVEPRASNAGLLAVFDSERDAELRRYRGRHPAVTMLLVVIIVLYSFTVVVNLAILFDSNGMDKLRQVYPTLPTWVVPVATICAATFVLSAITLMAGKKWGFTLMVLTSLAMVACQYLADSAGGELLVVGDELIVRVVKSSISLIWPIAVFFALRLGGPRSTWANLE